MQGPVLLVTLALTSIVQEPRQEIGLAPSEVRGELPPEAVQRLERALEVGLQEAGVQPRRIELPDCAGAACLSELRQESKSAFAVGLEVDVEGRDYTLRLSLIDARGRTSTFDGECIPCGLEEVEEAVQALALRVESKLEAVPGVLSVESDPPGALVYVDEKLVGRTPWEGELPGGDHELRVSLEGYIDRRESLSMVGANEERSFALQAAPVEGPEGEDSDPGARAGQDRARIAAGAGLLAAGLALVGTGGVLLSFHHDPVPDRCEDPESIDLNGLCRWRYETLGTGVGTLATGVVAAGIGGTLLALGLKGRRSTVALGPRSLTFRTVF